MGHHRDRKDQFERRKSSSSKGSSSGGPSPLLMFLAGATPVQGLFGGGGGHSYSVGSSSGGGSSSRSSGSRSHRSSHSTGSDYSSYDTPRGSRHEPPAAGYSSSPRGRPVFPASASRGRAVHDDDDDEEEGPSYGHARGGYSSPLDGGMPAYTRCRRQSGVSYHSSGGGGGASESRHPSGARIITVEPKN
jgi:hypothetical protein